MFGLAVRFCRATSQWPQANLSSTQIMIEVQIVITVGVIIAGNKWSYRLPEQADRPHIHRTRHDGVPVRKATQFPI